jgi:hypothetical protein
VIHWQVTEVEELAATIRAYGWQTTGVESEDGARAAKAVRADPPDVLVISLARLPSHGRHTAAYLRQVKAIQALPIVFVGGTKEAVTKTREQVPDAVYVSLQGLSAALESLSSD